MIEQLLKKNALAAVGEIIVGILCLIFKEGVISIATTIFGIILIVEGILILVNSMIKTRTEGIIRLVVGIILIVLGWAVTTIMFYILAVVLVVYGIMNLVTLIKEKSKDISVYIRPILQIVMGALLFLNQTTFLTWIVIIVGILLIVEGVLELIFIIKLTK